ncbi:MAG: hypothetical protein QW057_03705 [Candidatus Bathyarchaeia archaeon]
MSEHGGYAKAETSEARFPSFKVDVVDPSGAGEAFCEHPPETRRGTLRRG